MITVLETLGPFIAKNMEVSIMSEDYYSFKFDNHTILGA